MLPNQMPLLRYVIPNSPKEEDFIEIFLYANGDYGVGGVIVTGSVAGLEVGQEFKSVVTGSEFDFQVFQIVSF